MRNRHNQVKISVTFAEGFDPKKLSSEELNQLNSHLCEILQDTLLFAAFQVSEKGNEE